MTRFLTLALLALALFAHGETAQKKSSSPDKENVKEGPSTDGPPVAAVSSIEETDIQGFEHYAPQIQELIRQSLALTKLNLTYTFGSADPKNGGMDCSGAIFFVLSDFGFKGVPRQSNEMAGWVKDKTLLHRVEKADSLSHPEFSSLQPGNLLFWSGTYDAGPREIPVTHVMLYLGKLKKSGKHVVFGASDGRAYQGKRRTGVSVFDFSLPRSTSSATFYGYGMIPGVGKIEPKAKPPAPVVLAEKKTEAEPAPAPAPAAKSASAKSQETAKVSPAPTPTSAAKASAESKDKAATESKEKKEEPKMAAATEKEEVRPAIPIEKKTEPATAKAEPPPVKKTEAKTVAAKPAAAAKPATAKPKSSAPAKSTSSKPTTVAKRKPAPPPPTPLEKARQATSSFFKDVRKNFP